MPGKRTLTMRQLRHLLCLIHGGASTREVCRILGLARSTVQDNVKRAAVAGLSWPLPGDLTDDALEQLLFTRPGNKTGARLRAEPDWASLVGEMKKPGVTMMLLWEEYRAVHPDGYGYSRFCELFSHFERRLAPSMRQDHVAGDKVFVDYSGKKLAIADPATGEVREAEIFVAVLGASGYTFAEASWTQTLPDWIGSHGRMFRFFGGVPRLIVPDNLKAGVNRASFYDPEINRSYAMMASHYGTAVLPARPRRPKDKAKVENGVRFAQTCILGRLRKRTFFSLAEANAAIAEAVDRINDHLIRRLATTRRELFRTVELPALAPLPSEDYEFAEWRFVRVSIDYHVEFDGYFYSAPHELIREQVDLRATARIIEIFHRGRRVASHQRRYGGRRHGTDPDHMPSSHRRYAEWTPDRFRRWGASIGPNTEGLITAILAARPHPEQGFRSCLGVLRLYKVLDMVTAEAVSTRALTIGALTYKSIASIIANRLGNKAAGRRGHQPAVEQHANLRGPGYFH